jgi:hypothetical protein
MGQLPVVILTMSERFKAACRWRVSRAGIQPWLACRLAVGEVVMGWEGNTPSILTLARDAAYAWFPS